MTAVFPYQPVAPFPDTGSIVTMTPKAIDKVRQLEVESLKRPQIRLPIQHTIHYGIYTRTVFIPAGVLLGASLIKTPTTVIVAGDCLFHVGTDDPLPFSGYNIVTASAGRKVAVLAITNTYVSMMFVTRSRTVDEAEREFTDEYELLASRRDEMNVVNITGE